MAARDNLSVQFGTGDPKTFIGPMPKVGWRKEQQSHYEHTRQAEAAEAHGDMKRATWHRNAASFAMQDFKAVDQLAREHKWGPYTEGSG